MSAIPVDVHGSTQHVVELASTADVGEGAETIDMDTLCASGVAGIDAQACVPTDVPEGCEREPNKFCVMHPDPTCASRLKLCEECTRYMYSDASLSQRRHLTACLSAPDRERAHEPHPSAPNPHRLDMFHLPRGYVHLKIEYVLTASNIECYLFIRTSISLVYRVQITSTSIFVPGQMRDCVKYGTTTRLAFVHSRSRRLLIAANGINYKKYS